MAAKILVPIIIFNNEGIILANIIAFIHWLTPLISQIFSFLIFAFFYHSFAPYMA